jgi:hypothetical protein
MSEHNPFLVLVDQKAQSIAPEFPPTTEQQLILDAFGAGDDLVITAGAGTGKTSTITMLADALHAADRSAHGVYLAFNKAIATEVGGKFRHNNVAASTIHSLAWRGSQTIPHIAALMHKLNAGRGGQGVQTLKVSERPAAFGVPKNLGFGAQDAPVHPNNNPLLANLAGSTACAEAIDAIKRFCQSDADQVERQHVMIPDGIDTRIRDRYRDKIVEVARKMWDTDICSPEGRLPFTHDYYLKLYSLSNPDISAQLGLDGRRTVLFFDEAQDSRPCVTKIVMAQRGKMQLVLCGDSAQSIYRFLGCRDAMKGFKEQDKVTHLTLSKTFRFGTAIASVANQVLAQIDGSDVRIVPDFSIPSVVHTAPADGYPCDENGKLVKAIICRSNSSLIVNAVLLLQEGKRVHCVTDTSMIENIAQDYLTLSQGGRPKTPVMWQFRSIEQLRQFISKSDNDSNAAGSDDNADNADNLDAEVDEILLSVLRTVDTVGAQEVIRAMQSLEPTEAKADVIISTIHKAKGRQWDSVYIDWDAGSLTRTNRVSTINDELMLMYVAVTRARRVLVMQSEALFNLDVESPHDAATSNPQLYGMLTEGDELTREAAELLFAMHPEAPWCLVTDLVSDKVAAHELVRMVVLTSELIASAAGDGKPSIPVNRATRGALTLNAMGEIGLKSLRELLELQSTGFPEELLKAMIELRGTTTSTDIVGKLLGLST